MGMDMTINRLPAPTWNWLHVNEVSLKGVSAPSKGRLTAETPASIHFYTEHINIEETVQPAGKSTASETGADQGVETCNKTADKTAEAEQLAQIATGLGADMDELAKQGETSFDIWEIAPGVRESEPVRLHFTYEPGDTVQNRIGIRLGAGSEMTVIMDYCTADLWSNGSLPADGSPSSGGECVQGEPVSAKTAENNVTKKAEENAGRNTESEEPEFSVPEERNENAASTVPEKRIENAASSVTEGQTDFSASAYKSPEPACRSLGAVQTKIRLGKGAHLRLVQIQKLPDEFTFLNDVGTDCAQGAKIETIQIVLGGGSTCMGMRTELGGRKSELESKIGYLLDNKESLDMNYLAYQTGAKTTSRMDVSGVLRGSSKKLFRGTIDFRNGAVGAKGDEKEDVLLLSDGVENRTVPLILCEEEDVEGNHGATIGRLDESLLFYLSSRGIEENEIYEMMARARIDALCADIQDEKTRCLVQRCMG
ncbi:MAG: SufD family Fe-S cluster assembly protein [Lachnospiraceae bacterium]|nr:SufD family Fe-S cluster assembly protein [Lachnospiraceae bacterium]